MSAAAFEADEEEAILAGAQYYLTKPFSPDRLIEVVSKLVPPLRLAAEA
jgi:CheY-like chemotaxis protein